MIISILLFTTRNRLAFLISTHKIITMYIFKALFDVSRRKTDLYGYE